MKSKATELALMARGFDSKFASHLVRGRWTLAKLARCTTDKLRELGLSEEQVRAVHGGGRPPIPPETLYKLLYDCRHICCICRERGRPIIIHHITDWSESRSHDEDNLVVLCLNCHGDVHTHRELSQNITPEKIRHHKKAWQEQVKDDTLAERFASSAPGFTVPFWDHLNHRRILDAASAYGIRVDDNALFRELVADKAMSKDGMPRTAVSLEERTASNYAYELYDRRVIKLYQQLLKAVLAKMDVVDLTVSWNRSTARLLVDGSVAIFAGGWRFRKHRRGAIAFGPGQSRTAYVRKRGICLTFDFDGWETTSTSSWGHLAGSWSCTGICVVRSVESREKTLTIQATALAVGTGFKILE